MANSPEPPPNPFRDADHPRAAALNSLTCRERDVLRRLTTLNRPPDIARELGLSEPTVRTHIANARRKLGGVGAFDAARALAEAEGRHQSLPNQPLPMPLRPIGWRDLLPLRRKGAIGNDLNLVLRLLWIPLLAGLLAVAFGQLAAGAEVVSRFVAALR